MLSDIFSPKYDVNVLPPGVATAKKKKVLVNCHGKVTGNRTTEAHFAYLVIFGKPGSVLAKVSTVQCTCWWVRSTQTASKT